MGHTIYFRGQEHENGWEEHESDFEALLEALPRSSLELCVSDAMAAPVHLSPLQEGLVS